MMRWLLLKKMKNSKDEAEGIGCIERLIDLDPFRVGRYKDLKTQLAIMESSEN